MGRLKMGRVAAAVLVPVALSGCGGGAIGGGTSSTTTRARLPGRPPRTEGSGVLTEVDRHYPSGSAAQATAPTIAPRAGGTSTVFTVRLTVRQSLGAHGHATRDYRLLLAGPRPRCAVFTELTYARLGSRAGVSLRPPIELGWCRGEYHGQVLLETNPSCPPASTKGRKRPCRLFATEFAQVGRFSFVTR